jgi:DNA-binding GntR family transcriptional regulator
MTLIERTSLREQVRLAIRADIVTGIVRSGEVHTVGAFAERLGVSATPVREALLDLASEGLVELIPNRGFRVPSLSSHDLDELVELRLILEVAAIDRLVGRIGSSQLTELRHWAQQTVDHAKHRDLSGFLEADRKFHLLLLAQHENRRLVDLVASLRDQTPLHGLPHLALESLTKSAEEHLELIDAITQGDLDRSHQSIERHIYHVRGLWAGRSEQEAASDG